MRHALSAVLAGLVFSAAVGGLAPAAEPDGTPLAPIQGATAGLGHCSRACSPGYSRAALRATNSDDITYDSSVSAYQLKIQCADPPSTSYVWYS